MTGISFRTDHWKPSRQELDRLMAPGYAQGHLISMKVIGRIFMLVLPPLARPGELSGDVVFAESALPGMTAIPILIVNHPESLRGSDQFAEWRRRMEDEGNAFLLDRDMASSTPAPTLHRVEFSLGSYQMSGGLCEVVRLAPGAKFTRGFYLLKNALIAQVRNSAFGISYSEIEPVWIIN